MKEIARPELYALVWSEPMRTLAPRFGVSDVALRKACVKAAIPVPERGYWARLQAGKKAIRAKLPVRPPGLSEVVQIGRGRYHLYHSPSREELLGPLPEPPNFEEPIEAVEERVKAMIGKVRLTRSLDSPHHVIGRLLKADDERREKQRKSGYLSSWDAPLFESSFEQRRLRILNTLLLATAKAGARPSIRGREGREITIEVNDHAVGLRLDTPANLKKDLRYDRIIAGDAKSKLRLVILQGAGTSSERWAWEDTEDRKLESQLEEIAVRLVLAAEIQLREHRRQQYEWRLERREQIIEEDRLARERAEREERERREREASERIDRLLGEADALAKAETIRTYVERVRSLAGSSGEDRELVERWSKWALAVADGIDPVLSHCFADGFEPPPAPPSHPA